MSCFSDPDPQFPPTSKVGGEGRPTGTRSVGGIGSHRYVPLFFSEDVELTKIRYLYKIFDMS